MAGSRYLSQLRTKIDAYFNREELITLCFDLGVDYDSLPGRGKSNKVRDLVSLLDRQNRIAEVVKLCQTQRPNVAWTYQARIFISYKRYAEPDEPLANYLYQQLSDQGHQVFIDTSMRTGTDWLNEIDGQIKESDFLVVLLSPVSADSEMVQAEVQRAYNYSKIQGYPGIMPVRVAFEGLLPYTIDAYLSPLQYVSWHNQADNDGVVQAVSEAIRGRLPEQEPISQPFPEEEIFISEDGRSLEYQEALHPPLPEFDPRILEALVAPGGTLRLRDKFYIERRADALLKRQLSRTGSITTIRAPRQSGKSSLLVRGVHHARRQGAKVVNLDLQQLDRDDLGSADAFLYYLAHFIVRKLRLNPAEVEKMWDSPLGHQDKITYFMEDIVLPKTVHPIILAIDEADRLLETDYYTDFFALIRSWHNNAAYDPAWENLNLVLVISTEPYLLIANSNQSPFNVGLKLYLEDFDEIQVQTLNQRHGYPVDAANFAHFMRLLGGHPYLTRKAFYTLITEQLSWPAFMDVVVKDQGPFGDHLRRQLWLLRDQPALVTALKQILRRNRCDDQAARFRLVRAGLAKSSGDVCSPRCDLYRLYFREKLV